MTRIRPTVVLAALSVAAAQVSAQEPDLTRTKLPTESADVVGYEMVVRLGREKGAAEDKPLRYLDGQQKIRFRNITRASTHEIRMHLYLNAFKNLRSTHLREAEDRLRKRFKTQDEFGWIRVDKLVLTKGAGATAEVELKPQFISPDDGNPDDQTVIRAELPGALEPGQTIELTTKFTAKLPKAYRRTGWGPGDFFMVAQWFPKLGVLENAPEDKAAWNCHQFHANSEFYASYGTYDVKIQTPERFKVGATGKQQGKEKQLDDGYVERQFVQKDVHDFAWVADPDFRDISWDFRERDISPDLLERLHVAEIKKIQKDKLGETDADLALSDVRVRMLLQPDHASKQVQNRYERAIQAALVFFGTRFGRYPYQTLTVVDPCRDVGWDNLGGGMEYPTLITCGTPPLLNNRWLAPEGVAIHEFGHQFWYGLSGNNEFEQSWLDEGLNSYSEGRAQDLAYDSVFSDTGVGNPVEVTKFGRIYPIDGMPLGTLAGVGSGAIADLTAMRRLDLGPLESRVPAVKKALESARFTGNLLDEQYGFRACIELPFFTYAQGVPYRSFYADRSSFLNAPMTDPVVSKAWDYLNRASYRTNSYQRPSTILSTLERMMGYAEWWAFMRRFHERVRFTHPDTDDFLTMLGEFSKDKPEVLAFAKDAFLTTKKLDYGVRVRQVPEPAHRGYFDVEASETGPGVTEATVHRYGDMVVPVDVLFVFAKNGKRVTRWERWSADHQTDWHRYRFTPEDIAKLGELVEVYVDPPYRLLPEGKQFEPAIGPAGVYVVDENLLNNAWMKHPNRTPARRRTLRAFLWAQTVLSFFGGLG